MSSGIQLDDACVSTFNELKLQKKYKYIIYTINKEKTHIVVEKTSSDADYEAFLGDLPETEPRYAVYDFEFEKEGAGKRNKITFVAWSPDDAPVKSKMLFASSKDALQKALVGIAVTLQGTDPSEVAYESLLDKANKGH